MPPKRKRSDTPPGLSSGHWRYLKARAVDAAVAAERGYRSVDADDRQLLHANGFAAGTPLPGLLVPVTWNQEQVSCQVRPNEPREIDGRIAKFEGPPGQGKRLDCHPRAASQLTDPSVPLFITEGVPKGDALVSKKLCAIALLGVWSWRGRPQGADETCVLPDWDDVELMQREVHVVYDADVIRKRPVELALQRLTADVLVARGARVRWVYLPESLPGVDKVGVDDYLAAGHSVEDLVRRSQLPKFRINAASRPLHITTTLALAALTCRNSPPTVFRRGRMLVEVDASTHAIEPLDKDRLRNRLDRVADWQKEKINGEQVIETTAVSPPSEVVADALVSYEQQSSFPDLDRVVTAPVFAQDGSLRLEPGFHAPSSSLYLPPRDLRVPPIAQEPADSAVSNALALVDDLLADFPFAGEADRAHAIAMMLQPFARELIRGETPLYVIEAPSEGSGKTLLGRTCLIPAVGEPTRIPLPDRDEEVEKRITASFLAGEPVIFLDNVTRKVDSPTLASALTMEEFKGRVLGKSQYVVAPNNVIWLLTGNNPTFSPEINRRAIRIRLDAQMDRPYSRSGFRHSLPADAREQRGELVAACCTLIAHWLSLERPGPDDEVVPSIGSFSAWRYVLGGVLASAGVSGFMANVFDPRGESTTEEHAALQAVFRAIKDNAGADRPFTAAQLEGWLLRAEPTAIALLIQGETRLNSTVLIGRWLAKNRGRTLGRYQLDKFHGQRKNTGNRWQLLSLPDKGTPK